MALMNRCIFGTALRHEDTEEILTKYGHTARVGNLELHAGNYEYSRRGDANWVFVLDRDDYRYISLRKNIGVYDIPNVVGCLLGCLVGIEGDLIRFRITESKPSHLLLCCIDTETSREKAQAAQPDALTDEAGRNCFFAVYSLSRPVTSNYARGDDYYDNYYDDDPDSEDVYDDRNSELSEHDLVQLRLSSSGF
ncbi:hypothetical protein IJM16_02820 [Candidatus Saccharibacteria bacterium]|nr:hypothetical protein [Candidatus Saccharibacteria bacterium]